MALALEQAEGKIQYQALEEFRHEIRRFLTFSEHAAREAGIEPHQHQALLVIKSAASGTKATVGFLAERLQIQHHSAVELSDRLQEKNLIRRSRSGADKREVLLSLTKRGERLLERLSELHRSELQTTGPRLLKALQAVIKRAGAVGRQSAAGRRRRNRKTRS
ncbi:MAG TPA: MarR family transcriptional regulator [Candidatus Acidoferrales bacterium]|nr:MarR family transcriptional regulator [Candidatus Acidoferrales bacterium]